MQPASRNAIRSPAPRRRPARQRPRRRTPPLAAHRPAPQAIPPKPAARSRPARARRLSGSSILAVTLGAALALTLLCLLTVLTGAAALYGNGKILPGIHMAGVEIGGLSEADAAQALTAAWDMNGLVLRDGERAWTVDAAALGIRLDAEASAAAARAWGRSAGGPVAALRALAGRAALSPVVTIDWTALADALSEQRIAIDLPAKNAGVRLVGGQAAARPAEPGRALDIPATLARLRSDPGGALADRTLDLVMAETAPAFVDAAPLVAQANALLAAPFLVHAYDPVRDEWTRWTAPPDVWAQWIVAASEADSASGLALSLDAQGPAAFLAASATFDDERYLNIDRAVAAMQRAVQAGQTEVTIRVWHKPTSYTVSSGQTLARIGEEVGIPYPYILAANPGINADALYAGQTLTLPSRDDLLPLEPVPGKRIVVSRTQQRLWASENGQVVFEWPVSTGIASSPTAPGVFQVQSHELNAYGEQWNLYMPHFVGFYHPGPNVEVMNGFHGFPTSASGGYLLWTDDLGHPATYGCVLLSLENAAALYDWAEPGVVVEVRP